MTICGEGAISRAGISVPHDAPLRASGPGRQTDTHTAPRVCSVGASPGWNGLQAAGHGSRWEVRMSLNLVARGRGRL